MGSKPSLIRFFPILQCIRVDRYVSEFDFSRGLKVIFNHGLGIISASNIVIGPVLWPLPTVAVPFFDLSARNDLVSPIHNRDLQIVYASTARKLVLFDRDGSIVTAGEVKYCMRNV